MTRYILLAATVAALASLCACVTDWAPEPQVGRPSARGDDHRENAAYSSQLSVMNRRAQHADKDASSSSSSR